MKVKKAVIVYQGGIANVFKVQCLNMANFGRGAKRLIQGTIRECEAFARGLGAAGVVVREAHCNMAGDIVDALWDENLESAPYYKLFRTCKAN